MKEINYSAGKNYEDFEGAAFFKAYGLERVKFTTREVAMKNGAKVKLFNLDAYNPNDGRVISLDMWPTNCQTTNDLNAIPAEVSDIRIRFGIYTDEETGETVEAAAPRVVGYRAGGDLIKFNGPKPAYSTNGSVWTNEEPVE